MATNSGPDFDALMSAPAADDTAVIEAAAVAMVRSGDRRFVEPLIELLSAEDAEGAHVADHVVWALDEHRASAPLADEVLRRVHWDQ